MVDVLVVGAGVAGTSAALAAARRGAKTTLVESSARVGVSKALWPSLLSGDLKAQDILLPEAKLLADEGVDVRQGIAVASVDRKKKRVALGSPRDATIAFDRLVICTGSSGDPPRMRGVSKPNVFVLYGAEDYLKLSSALADLETIVVSGPVPVALKIGQILAEKGKHARVYCGANGLALQFSPPVASAIRQQASRAGTAGQVELLDSSIDSVLGVKRAEAVVSGGTVTTCDGVVLVPSSVPVFPEVDCERGRNGGLLVDASMSTSVPGIFAAGDSAEFRFKSGSIPARLQSTSFMGGEVAGINAAGGSASAAPSWAAEEIYFGVEFCSAGLTGDEAKSLGLGAATQAVEAGEKPRQTFVTLVFDTETYQVYGLQVAGWRALALAGAASLVVSLGVTVQQLLHIESPYTQQSGYELSPIALTARKILGAR